MRLLILTQKVDKNDDLLGFFHTWLFQFAARFDRITVICLSKGIYDLPDNVSVYSLGKEEGVSKIRYIIRFFRYIVKLRKEYDTVFVHMNPEYVVLGGLLWCLWGKRILMWYNHPQGNFYIRCARFMSFRVLHTSPFAFASRFKNALQMPVGIPMESFRKDKATKRKVRTFLSLGRISPIKKVDLILEAAQVLHKQQTRFVVSIYGQPTNESDRQYEKILKTKYQELLQIGVVSLCGGVPNYKTKDVYSQHEIFVNVTPSGSFDKAILEAMASELVVVTSNQSLCGILPDALLPKEGDVESLAESMRYALTLSPDEKEQYGKFAREYVLREHSLEVLVGRFAKLCAL